MEIEAFEAHNMMKITTATIKFDKDKNVFVIGGRNAQGKSALLDAIAINLGGKKYAPEKTVHEGADKGWTKLTTDKLTIERVFNASGTMTVKVSNPDGSVRQKPQALLDTLFTAISFDPVKFFNAPPADQTKTLKDLIGLDFTAMDAERAKLYAERTIVNRELDTAKKNLAQAVFHPDAPAEEVSVSGLMSDLKIAQAVNILNQKERASLENCDKRISEREAKILELENQLSEAKRNLEISKGERDFQANIVSKLVDSDESSIQAKITGADAVNSKVRANRAHANAKANVEAKQAESNARTLDIQAIDTKKESMLAAAKFPIPGLGFGETGVTYQGFPLEQASSAEKIRVSLAIGAALSPELKLAMIYDGSLLDAENMQILDTIAKEYGIKVLVERVGDEGFVIIEDGQSMTADEAKAYRDETRIYTEDDV